MSIVIEDTIKGIAALETEMLNSDEVYPREEIFARLTEIFCGEYSFDLYFRERRRFEEPELRDALDKNWLFFQYLSIFVEDGKIKTISNPEAVVARYRERVADGKQFLVVENRKTVLVVPTIKNTNGAARIANRVAKLILSFYYASGSHDHFVANLSRKHTATYLSAAFDRDPTKIVAYCESHFNVSAAYVFQLSEDTEFESIVDRHNLVPTLTKYDGFQHDLRQSYSSKQSRLGTTQDGMWHYAIYPLVDEAFGAHRGTEIGSESPPVYLSRRGTLVIAKSGGRLPLDIGKIAPALFAAQRNEARTKERDEFFREVQRAGERLEDLFAAHPPETTHQLYQKLATEIRNTLRKLSQQQTCDWCEVRLFDLFSNALHEPVVEASGEFDGRQSTGVGSYLSELLLETQQPIHLRDLERAAAANDSQLRQIVQSNIPHGLRSFYATPIKVGRLTAGWIVIASRWPGLFHGELLYFEAVAQGLGDFIRRIELVSDIAWLSRLSFFHSARHDLEGFARALGGQNERALLELVNQYSGLSNKRTSYGVIDSKAFGSELTGAFKQAGFSSLAEAQDFSQVPLQASDTVLVRQIVSQIISNAKAHSEPAKDSVRASIEALQGSASAIWELSYLSAVGRTPLSNVLKLGTAPIPDSLSGTYHFGYFLSAVQARMLGGRSSVRPIAADAFETSQIEVRFKIPLMTGGDNDV